MDTARVLADSELNQPDRPQLLPTPASLEYYDEVRVTDQRVGLTHSHAYNGNIPAGVLVTPCTLMKSEVEVAAASGVLLSATDDQPLNWGPRGHLAQAAAEVLHGEGHLAKTYGLTASEAFTYNDLATALSEVPGRSIVHCIAEPKSVVAALTEGSVGTEHALSIVDTFHAAIAQRKFTDHHDTLQRFTGRSASRGNFVARPRACIRHKKTISFGD